MQTGDVLFYRGTSLISKVIAWITKSPYTHVALAIGDGTIIEAQRFIKTTIREINPSEVYEVYRTELTEEQKERIHTLAFVYKDTPYDYLEMLGILLRIFTKGRKNLVESANKVYCSEVIDYIFYASGVKRWNKIHVGDVYPHELIQVYNLRKVTNDPIQ